MRLMKFTAGILILLIVGSVHPVHNTYAAAGCLPWNSARQVIKQNGLVTAGEVRQRFGRSSKSRLIDLRLCKQGGRYVYKVVTMKPGRVNKIVVDARSGSRMRGGAINSGPRHMPAGVGSGIRAKKILKMFKRKKNRY